MCTVTEQLSPGTAAGSPRSAGRTIDLVTTLLLLALMLGGAAVLGLFSLMSVMATDSCGTGGPDAAICDGNYFAVVLLGYWAVLVGVPVLATVASAVRLTRRRLAWPYAVGGLLGLVLVTIVYVLLLTR